MSRMITMAAAILAYLLCAQPLDAAAESNDVMDVLYANTLTCQGERDDNWLCYDWYYPEGYYLEMQVVRRRDGLMAVHGVQGNFTVQKTGAGQTLCQSLDGVHTWCRELKPHKVGDHWQERLPNGHTQKFAILKGRELGFNNPAGTGGTLTPHQYPEF